jgi:2-oxoisovalerate dehydrogenase E1 component
MKKLNTHQKKKISVYRCYFTSLRQSMERHENSVIMGQDISEYGGAFKITDGFVAQFGKSA